jgi:GAF domain-containing protein
MRVQPQIDLILALQPIAEDLFAKIEPLRVNIRVQTTDNRNYPVLAEALAPGAFSLSGGMSQLGYQGDDIHNMPTVRLMRESRQPIVQRDTSVDPPKVPHARAFGGQAGQVLMPLEHDSEFVGFLAVHSHGEPHDWTADELAAIEEARRAAERELANAFWFDV